MTNQPITPPSPVYATPGPAETRDYPNAYAPFPVNAKGIVCPHTGLRHAHLAKLLRPGGLAAAYVRVVRLKEPGARHGKTLFHVGDMLRWLDYLSATQTVHAGNHSAVEACFPQQA